MLVNLTGTIGKEQNKVYEYFMKVSIWNVLEKSS